MPAMGNEQSSRKEGRNASHVLLAGRISSSTKQPEVRDAAHVALKQDNDAGTTEPEARNAALQVLKQTDDAATSELGVHDAARALLAGQGATGAVAHGGFAAPEALARRIRYTNEALVTAPPMEQHMTEQETPHAALHDLTRVSEEAAEAGGRERS
jgi:hypothetical protein